MIKKFVKSNTIAGALALAGSVLLASGMAVNAENSYVTGFGTGGPAGTDGWKSDDTRNAGGINLIGGADFANPGYTHAPGTGVNTPGSNIYDPAAVAAQIDWQNFYGSRGNLGLLNLTANVTSGSPFTAGQKSTVSVINSTSGLGSAASALGEDFSATYRFNKTSNNSPSMGGGVALKIGVQSNNWAASQVGYTASRSGESSWDLILVHDPSFDGVDYSAAGVYTENVTASQGVWKLFGQVSNSYWTSPEGPGAPPGGSAPAKTLEEWAADPVWGPLLFGANAKVADVQFGVGSGNAGMAAGLDWAQISFLNEGGTIDFVDASTWTGNAGDNEFKTATNWTTNGMLQGPSADNNVVFTGSGTTTANVSTNTDARSIAAGSGTVNLVVAPARTLSLLNNGFLSAEKGATLNLSGGAGSQVTAAAVEAWGNVNLATKVTLDGGSVNQPVRAGRYAIVVAEGGELTLENGADITVGNATGANGVKTLIRVGEMTAEGGVGVMNIEDGAHLTAGSTTGSANWTGFHVGDWGGEGVVNQTGGIVDLFGGLLLGNEAAGTTADLGSKGTYNLSGGTLNIYRPAGDNGALIIGRATANRYSEGILNVSGGLLDLGAVGGAPGNVAMVVGGLADNVATNANAKGTVNQTAGTVRFTNAKLVFGRGQGTYNLNGGTLEIGGTNGISTTPGGNYAFNFGGGTLKVINSNLTTSIDANIVADKRSYIDTNGFDATWGGNFVSAGLHQIGLGGSYLEKRGDGRLTLSGASRVMDTFAVTDGEVRQTAGATSAVEFMVGSGAGSTAAFLMEGGTFQVNPSTRISNGTAVSGSFRVGDFNGTGSFTQTAGTVNFANNSALLVGNRGGIGTYSISGGDVQMSRDSLNVLGRNDPQDGNPDNTGFAKDLGSSEGTLNISGTGLVEVAGNGTSGGNLILSSNQNTVNLAIGRASKGTINQTGGTLRINNGASLYLGAAGSGVYNLNGGALEIGGNSLQGVYGNLGGTYDFNLGGGTIKVIGSNLVTGVNADLVAETRSYIDTNGFDATWGGNFVSAGLHQIGLGGSYLEKRGDGTLILSGASRVLDTFAVTDGEARQTAGATSAVEFMVGTGAGSTASFTMAGGTIQINPSTRISNGDPVSGSFRVGDFNGTGTFDQNAGTVTVTPNSALIVGNRGGTGTYNANGGTLQLSNALNILGRNDAQDGNPLNPGFAKDLGSSEGTLNISGNSLVELLTGGSLVLSSNVVTVNAAIGRASKGTINQTGGTLRINNGASLFLGAAGDGEYNLSGGVLEIGGDSLKGVYNGIGGSYAFNLDGGTVRVIGNDLTTSVASTLKATKRSTIDTNGRNATWSGNLSGAGALSKVGAGTLTLNSTTASTIGQLAVSGGTTAISSTITATGGSFIPQAPFFESNGQRDAVFVNNDATLELKNGANLTVNSDDDKTAFLRVGYGSDGTMVIEDGASLTVGQLSRYANIQIGQGEGVEGTVIQDGGSVSAMGSLNIGVNGGTGTYTINDGTLTFDHSDTYGSTSLLSVGFNNAASTTGTSTGELNINGGLVDIRPTHLVGASYGSTGFIIGNRVNTALGGGASGLGNGTVNQTGGVLRIGARAGFYLSGYGNGVYNLNGGALEIGGDSLQAKYGNGTSTYDFNLGGGTIKVIDSDLDTAVDANLVANTTSTIDTNGFDANWAGALTGNGLHQIGQGGSKLIKKGLGTLSFTGSGTRKLDTFAVEGGAGRQTAGTTSAVEFMVGTATGNTGDYLMEGGVLNINASTNSGGNPVAGSFRVGDFGGTGTFTQTGGDVILGANSALNIGNRSGQGVYDISGGKLELTSINVMGRNTTNDLIASEGELNISGDALVDMLTGSSWILSSNTNTNNTAIARASKGTINQSGGTLRVRNGANLYLGAFGTGAYNLTGGTLEIGGASLNGIYNNTGGSYSFTLGGGTIKVIGSHLNTSVNAGLSANGATSTIDTNGFNATWAGDLTADGLHQVDHGGSKLVKKGAGNLAFTGTSRVLDTFAVEGGSAQQTAGTTSAVEFMVGTGNGNTGAYLMDAGTLSIKTSTNTVGDVVSGSFRVGDFGGTGTFTQTGGAVVLDPNSALNIGNRGGDGTYDISGGSLTLSSINVFGRNRTTDTVSSDGVLNLSGTGLVELLDGSSIILSSQETTNNASVAQASTATINQTGGTFRVNNGADIYLGARGAGTYNLEGGTLEIGGDSLNGVYNSVGGSYTFNLDGGTLKVIGSDLNTDVDATLKTAGKTSTIDTNGFAATFTGTISGPGNLTKVGTGELTVVESANIGTLLVSAGSAAFMSDYTGVDVILDGGDADFKGSNNVVSGDVTVRDGSQLMGSLSAEGTTTIEDGGTHQLCDESIVNVDGAYILKDGGTLIFDLDGSDFESARLTYASITIEDDSFVVLYSSVVMNVGDRVLLFDATVLNIGDAVNIQGAGEVAGYTFTLGADGYAIVAVPEPSVMVLLALALGFVVIFQMKKRRQA